jgi:hypothetical protein
MKRPDEFSSHKKGTVMKRLIASTLASLVAAAVLAAAPAQGEEPARKTELIDVDGTSVDKLQLRYDMDAAWVIDNRSILYRDTARDHYLVTLKEACTQLDTRRRSFKFFPSWSWRLLSTNTYEVRPRRGQECGIGRIERLDETRANAMRDMAQWRAW